MSNFYSKSVRSNLFRIETKKKKLWQTFEPDEMQFLLSIWNSCRILASSACTKRSVSSTWGITFSCLFHLQMLFSYCGCLFVRKKVKREQKEMRGFSRTIGWGPRLRDSRLQDIKYLGMFSGRTGADWGHIMYTAAASTGKPIIARNLIFIKVCIFKIFLFKTVFVLFSYRKIKCTNRKLKQRFLIWTINIDMMPCCSEKGQQLQTFKM